MSATEQVTVWPDCVQLPGTDTTRKSAGSDSVAVTSVAVIVPLKLSSTTVMSNGNPGSIFGAITPIATSALWAKAAEETSRKRERKRSRRVIRRVMGPGLNTDFVDRATTAL